MNARWLLVLLPILLLAAPSAAAVGGHYIPQVGDRFHYYETIYLGSGTGNYTGYYENSYINGTLGVTAVAANGTESASYSNTDSWSNSTGSSSLTTQSGSFTFSASTFHYVQGTDNQSGYTNPYVWFYLNNSLAPGSTVTLLNTDMSVVSTDSTFSVGAPLNENVKTIFAEGNGSYERNDEYGVFTATYNWKSYFDPSTGYIAGYVYTEQDSDGSGDGFAITDSLYVTSTTYPLTVASASSSTSSASGLSSLEILALVAIVVIVIVIVIVALVLRSRRSSTLPRHSAGGNVGFGPPPVMPQMSAPPPVHLTPSGQPAVQQIVMRETVKVPCRYCGTLIDSTATVCPNCGAPRT
jgi:hypothetical protein